MKKLIKKTQLFTKFLVTSAFFAMSITVAQASPYIKVSLLEIQPITWYVDLGKVTKISDRKYQYVKTGVSANIDLSITNEKQVEKMKLIQSKLIVNCNDTSSSLILENLYYQNGKLVKTENPNKSFRDSLSNPLKQENLIVCRFFDPISSQALKAGFYVVGLGSGIRIAINGNRICLEEFNRHNFTVASVIIHPEYLSLYQVESVEKKGFWTKNPYYLFQITSEEIYHGELINHGVKENGINWETSDELQQCLKSNRVFWHFEQNPGAW